ncbi:MAG: VanW family protein [Clostridiales bacterium]|nr:VanW family protein [Clostridiales bacterium]
MKKIRRLAALWICALLCLCAACAAGEADVEQDMDVIAQEEAAGVEVEGLAIDDEDEAMADGGELASIEGLTPLYTTKIKPFVSNGTSIRMRARQSGDSEVVCYIKAGEPITVYAVYPAYVLADYNGYVGYVIRTWVDENMVVLDPQNTPPYGVVPSQYVATLTQTADVYTQPSLDASIHNIRPGAGSKVAILEFVDGFAKVLIWRSYGYIDARLLTDLTVVAQGEEPLSEETPIAAFCSFFEYNTRKVGNEGRCRNIVRTCELMSRVMQPGETLNFNEQIGPYTRANGYFPAPVLVNGGSQIGSGGGTCQSSSTMYNTIRQLPGITILMRRPHGPGCARYLPMHQDAAVGNDSLNLIFRNDCGYPIRILAESTGEGTLCIQIFRADGA